MCGILGVTAVACSRDAAQPVADASVADAPVADAPVADAPVPENRPFQVVFPPPSGVSIEDTIVVRGFAPTDPATTAVRVNGVLATTDNGFADWQAAVPLAPGVNTLVVEIEDELGNRDPAAAELVVRRDTLVLSGMEAMALDPPRNRALILHHLGTEEELISVDLATRQAEVVSGVNRGSGPSMTFWRAIAMDPDTQQVWALDMDDDVIVSVDPATGNRAILSPNDASYGPLLTSGRAFAVDAARDRLLVAEVDSAALVAVDTTTGQRTYFSGAGAGSGPAFPYSPVDMVMDPASDRAVVVACDVAQNHGSCSLVTVDLATGAREVLPVTGLDTTVLMALDAAGNRLLVYESFESSQRLAWYDLATGAATELATEATITGQPFTVISDMALDMAGNRALFLDGGRNVLVGMDLDTGERSAIYGLYIGDGPGYWGAQGVAVQRSANRVFVSSAPSWGQPPLIASIDLNTSARKILAAPDEGTCPDLVGLRALALDEERNRLLALKDASVWLIAVDLTSGECRTLADDTMPDMPELSSAVDMAIDTRNDRAIILAENPNMVVAVDLVTGAGTVIAHADAYLPGNKIMRAIAVDEDHDTAIIGGYGEEIWRLDLTEGQVTVLASDYKGEGILVENMRGVRVDGLRDRVLVLGSYPWLSSQSIIALDPSTLKRRKLTEADLGYLGSGRAMDYDAASDVAWVIEHEGALKAIDLATGHGVIVSH